MLCFKESFLTPTTNACGVGPPSPTIGEGAIYAHRFLGRNIRELLCDRKVIKRGCATFVPPLSKGRGAACSTAVTEGIDRE